MASGSVVLESSDKLVGGHDTQALNWQTDPVAQTKLIASVVLLTITILCGYLPTRLIVNQDYVQHAMFAGGGVLMATAFCHLIPETHDSYKQATGGGGGADSSTLHGHDHSHHHHHHHQSVNVASTPPPPPMASTITTTTTVPPTPLAATGATNNTTELGEFFVSLGLAGPNIPYVEILLCCGFFFMYIVEQMMVKFVNNHTHRHPCDPDLGPNASDATQPPNTFFVDFQSNDSCGAGSTGGGSGGIALGVGGSAGNLSTAPITMPISPKPRHTGGSNGSVGAAAAGVRGKTGEFYKFIRGLLIVSAFAAHSIFDGVAIGSQTTIDKVWTIFAAISCHKLIIAAVVGLELHAATLESRLWTLVHLFIFSIMSPIGIVLVVIAQESLNLNSDSQPMILLQSFATGTLLYIIFIEILQPKKEDEFSGDKNKLAKCFSLIAGFMLMLVALTFIGEG